MKRIFLLGLMIPCMAIAQHNGVRFLSGLSWNQILAKAKAENKYVFVDCYATWCGPCKYMADSVFTQSSVGDFFNSHFLNVSVQLDQTNHDSQLTRDWYADAEFISRKYTVEMLPTYLFFAPDGSLVHRVVGIPGNRGADLVNQGGEAITPGKQNEVLLAEYKAHLHDSAYLRKALETSIKQTDEKNVERIGDAYFGLLRNPYTKETISLMVSSVHSTRDIGFSLLLSNLAVVDSVMGRPRYANSVLNMTVTNEWIDSIFRDTSNPINYHQFLTQVITEYPMLENSAKAKLSYFAEQNFKGAIIRKIRSQIYHKDAPAANWREILREARARYVDFDAREIILDQKWLYYASKKDTGNFERAVRTFLIDYHRILSAGAINKCCYYIYMYSNNSRLVHMALKLSKGVVADRNSVAPAYLDTYASLLYKTGDRQNALLWEELAVKASTLPSEKREFENTLKKWTLD